MANAVWEKPVRFLPLEHDYDLIRCAKKVMEQQNIVSGGRSLVVVASVYLNRKLAVVCGIGLGYFVFKRLQYLRCSQFSAFRTVANSHLPMVMHIKFYEHIRSDTRVIYSCHNFLKPNLRLEATQCLNNATNKKNPSPHLIAGGKPTGPIKP